MIEFHYFDDCPNSTESLKNLRELITEGFIKQDEIEIINIKDFNSAEEFNFQGSPSIIIDGYDIFTELIPHNYSFNCRIYTINGKKTGILPKEYIKQQILKIRG